MKRLLLWLLVLWLLMTVLVGCGGTTTTPSPPPSDPTTPAVSGRVTGVLSGAGIPGVTISYGSGTVTTDDQGRFTITGVSSPITVSPVAPTGAFNVTITPSSRTATAPQTNVNFNASWTKFETKWGTSGSLDGQFYVIYGLAVDASGNVYVSDWNHRIQKFDSNGNFLSRWGKLDNTSGTGDGEFNTPTGIAVDSSGYVYVADYNNHRIQKFTSSGGYVTKWGGSGGGNGQFSFPHGISVDSTGSVYVADSANGRIQKFDASGTPPYYAFDTTWYGGGGGADLAWPMGVAVNASGHVVVADRDSSVPVKTYAGSGATYAYVSQVAARGAGDGQVDSPYCLTIDSLGSLYVADTGNSRIVKYRLSGDDYVFDSQWGSNGTGNGQFDWPRGVAVDSAGNVFVGDTGNSRIQKFSQVQ